MLGRQFLIVIIQPLTIFAKSSTLDVRLGSKYASVTDTTLGKIGNIVRGVLI